MSRQCVILAGGLGTRLGALTQEVPKPLLEVAGKPFLAHVCANLRRQSIDRITILAGYKGDQIAAHFADDRHVEVLIEPEPVGTAGALRLAAGKGVLEEQFFLINGDTFFDINFADFACRPLTMDGSAALGRIALRRLSDTGRYGIVTREGTRVTSFDARPPVEGQSGYVNGGVYHLQRAVVELIPVGKASLEQDVFPKLAEQGLLHAVCYEAPFIDIGIPSDFERAQTFVPALTRRPALFLDRDGVVNKDIGYLNRIEDFVWVPGALATIKRASDLGYHVFVVTNQAGVARGFYAEDDVLTLHRWIGDRVFEAGGYISDFRYCPHHPQGIVSALARRCCCRKPDPGMLSDLLAHNDVDVSRSLIVGDKPSDLQAGEAVGVAGFLFQGGNLFEMVGAHLFAWKDWGRAQAHSFETGSDPRT